MTERIRFLLMSLIFCGCIQFKISDEDASKIFQESNVEIHFGDVLTGDRTIHFAYTDQKKECLLVFVHGSPGSWNAFIDYFKADSILISSDMVSIDRPGFGGSGFGLAEPNLEIQARQLKIVTDQFDHKIKILIGHSLGGSVIARVAMDYPDSFSGIIMVAPSIDPEMEKDEWYRGIIDTQIGSAFTPKEFEVSNDEIMPLKGELELMLPLWKKIQVPTIVIQGTSDQLVPKENADFAERMMPDSILEVRLLKDVNHFIPWNQPEEIVKAIQHLLDGL